MTWATEVATEAAETAVGTWEVAETAVGTWEGEETFNISSLVLDRKWNHVRQKT